MSLDPVTLATPFFILAIILEVALARLGATRTNYEAKDTAASLVMGLGSTLAGLLVGGVVAAATLYVYQHRLFDIPMTAVWAWIAIFLLEDLTYYWFHRLSHERRFWWAAHVNHHSSQHYNLSTALRQTWTGGIAGTWALWLPLAFLGFPPAMIAIQKGISLVYQFWIHTEAIGRMPRWFEAVFNTLASPRPSRPQPALPRPQLRRHPDRLGQAVRHLPARAGRGAVPLWHRQEPRRLQHSAGGVSRVGRNVGGCLAPSAPRARLPLRPAGLEP